MKKAHSRSSHISKIATACVINIGMDRTWQNNHEQSNKNNEINRKIRTNIATVAALSVSWIQCLKSLSHQRWRFVPPEGHRELHPQCHICQYKAWLHIMIYYDILCVTVSQQQKNVHTVLHTFLIRRCSVEDACNSDFSVHHLFFFFFASSLSGRWAVYPGVSHSCSELCWVLFCDWMDLDPCTKNRIEPNHLDWFIPLLVPSLCKMRNSHSVRSMMFVALFSRRSRRIISICRQSMASRNPESSH